MASSTRNALLISQFERIENDLIEKDFSICIAKKKMTIK